MLAVIEGQQEIAPVEEAHDLLRRRPLAAVPKTEGVGDRRDDQSGIAMVARSIQTTPSAKCLATS